MTLATGSLVMGVVAGSAAGVLIGSIGVGGIIIVPIMIQMDDVDVNDGLFVAGNRSCSHLLSFASPLRTTAPSDYCRYRWRSRRPWPATSRQA
jgi:hypothetical protein